MITKIKAEIERRIAYAIRTQNVLHRDDIEVTTSYAQEKCLKELLSFIESQEQKPQCDGCVNEKGCITCVDGNMKETSESLEKEQLKGLDEAAEAATSTHDIFWKCFDEYLNEHQDQILNAVCQKMQLRLNEETTTVQEEINRLTTLMNDLDAIKAQEGGER